MLKQPPASSQRYAQAGRVVIEIAINVALPYLIYVQAKTTVGDVPALIMSSLPPVIWSVIEFVRKRRVDAISIMVITGIVLSLLAFIGGGSARFLQLRENIVSALIAVAFLVSVAIDKPLGFIFARAMMARRSPAQAEKFAALQIHGSFRAAMRFMTLVWGVGLLASAVLACFLVYQLSIRDYLLISPFLSYGTFGALGLWSFWYGRERQRQGLAAKAAAAALE